MVEGRGGGEEGEVVSVAGSFYVRCLAAVTAIRWIIPVDILTIALDVSPSDISSAASETADTDERRERTSYFPSIPS